MLSFVPFPHGLLVKDDSMRKWSKKHKNYIQLQMRVKEFGGQGDQGPCSLHAFLTNLFLPNPNDGQRPEQPPVRRRAYLHVFSPDTHTYPQTLDILRAHGVSKEGRDCTTLLF